MHKKIQVTKSSMPPFDEYIEEIKELWDSCWLTNNGSKHIQLEQSLKEYLRCDNLVLFTNGHLALENIIQAYNLSGEVITTPFTFISTTNAIIRSNLKPVFCDINEDDYTIDADKIENLINKNTSAILPVHVYGNICEYEKIQKIADKYNLKVIYDAAHAFGEKVDNKSVAFLGDASMFSFHATKVYNTIEGGAVSFKDGSLYEKLNSIKNFGLSNHEELGYIGGNAKMNEFQAAMGLCNLRYVDRNILSRKRVVERYIERLKSIKGIKLYNYSKNIIPNYAYFPVMFDGYKLNRDEILLKLSENNIFARKYFYPLTSELLNIDSNTPVAKYVSEKILTLPVYDTLSIEEVDRICDLIQLA